MRRITKSNNPNKKEMIIPSAVMKKFTYQTGPDRLVINFNDAGYQGLKNDCLMEESVYATPNSWYGLIVWPDPSKENNTLCWCGGFNPMTQFGFIYTVITRYNL